MPQDKIPYKKKSDAPMMGTANLKLMSPVGEDSQYAKMFGMGENILRTLSRADPSSIWESYKAQAYTAADTLKQQPGPTAGALLLYEASKKFGIDIGSGSVKIPTKYGKFKLGTQNIGGSRGMKLSFDMDKSILGKLEQRLMK
jgi:hypothetical protein|tara:strand:- start:145 stop:573 length:429 start_codon:yes stop_codon:yes gene_type:complete